MKITKKEILWIDGKHSFHYEPSTYIIIYFWGFIPFWISLRDEWDDE